MALIVTGCSVAGCGGGPVRITALSIDPSRSSAKALELYDKNGDSLLDKTEYAASPGLAAIAADTDTDKDGSLSKNEIEARLREWQESSSAILTSSVTFTLNNRPLGGATVTFEPESFLQGDELPTIEGTTTPDGVCMPELPPDSGLPPQIKNGLPRGLYRVKVSRQSGGKETVPDRYNTNTELGLEVASFAMPRSGLRFDLSTRSK